MSWVVLLFYPGDFTFVCPTELEEAAKFYSEFQKLGAEVLSVSIDSAYVHKAWRDISPAIAKVNYPMLSDPSAKLCRAFGTFNDSENVSQRATFIIDPAGIVKAFELHDNRIGRSTPEILRKLQAAKYVEEHPTKACPASWQPGEEALTPGLELVGKI